MPKRGRESLDWSDDEAPDLKRHKEREESEYERLDYRRFRSRSPSPRDHSPIRYRHRREDSRSPEGRHRSHLYRDERIRRRSPAYDRFREDIGSGGIPPSGSSGYHHHSHHSHHSHHRRGEFDRYEREYRPRSRYNNNRRRNNSPRRVPMPNFGEEDQIIREENPHLQQNKEKVQKLETLERVLPKDAPRKEYYQRKGELRSTNHWGQRKLLLSEIEFLTEYGDRSSTVVYAGAAPGPRNEYLADLFPKHKFIFIDPNPFHEKLRQAADGNNRIELISELFTDELALNYRGKNVLFISNIRTADNTFMSKEEVEKTLVEDNRRQMSWHLQMEPVVSMLKFRLPWGAGITKYLSGYSENGKLYLPVWGGQTTTETSLVVSGNETYDYDNTIYEQQMFYFNTVQRCHYYKHAVKTRGVPGLCHCYDCSSEVQILSTWAKKFPKEWSDSENPTEAEIAEHVEMMCERLNKECSSVRRNLATKVSASWHKRYARESAIGWDTNSPTGMESREASSESRRSESEIDNNNNTTSEKSPDNNTNNNNDDDDS